jgi:hypothetical protein
MKCDPTRQRRRSSALVALPLLFCVACGQSEMVQSWTNPAPPGNGWGRILVVAVMASEGDRQIFESEFVKRFEDFKLDAVPSYRALRGDALNLENVRALVQRDNFTTVFLVETLSIDQATTSWVTGGQSSRSIPAEDQRSFGSSYQNAHDTMLDAPNTSVTTIATIQSSIYNVATEDLLWRGTSRTYDPGPAAKIVPPLSGMIVRTIQRAHIY